MLVLCSHILGLCLKERKAWMTPQTLVCVPSTSIIHNHLADVDFYTVSSEVSQNLHSL